MKLPLISLLLLISICSFSQTFRIDSIGHRKGNTLPLFEKGDTTKVYYYRVYGAGKPRVIIGTTGTIVKRKNRIILSFTKK